MEPYFYSGDRVRCDGKLGTVLYFTPKSPPLEAACFVLFDHQEDIPHNGTWVRAADCQMEYES